MSRVDPPLGEHRCALNTLTDAQGFSEEALSFCDGRGFFFCEEHVSRGTAKHTFEGDAHVTVKIVPYGQKVTYKMGLL